MTIRNYKWEDLEKLRKVFKTPVKKIMTEVGGSRQTYYATLNGKYAKESCDHWRKVVGMAWEIFAVYYVRQWRITRDMDIHMAYNYLVDYAWATDGKQRFNEWYEDRLEEWEM